MKAWPLLIALLCACACGGDDDGDTQPGDDGGTPGIDAAPADCSARTVDLALEPVATGLNEPLFVTSPPGDDRLFVVEKRGRIVIIENGSVVETPFLDIYDLVHWSLAPNEQGLLGLAFHPEFATNDLFYVFYIANESDEGAEAHVVAEYKVQAGNANLADPDSERRVLELGDDRSNHNGGMIAFGPDGYLYIGLGDGGGGNDPDGNGQDPETLLGNILRIDVDAAPPYGIPDDNPFFDSVGSEKKEIWLWGLRNPWRFSFDNNGDLYIGDVGQGALEEVDIIPAGVGGLNLGWPAMEGSNCRVADCSDFTGPAAEFPNPGDASITGGYVYRGSDAPDLVGWYFYGDWSSNSVYKLEHCDGETLRAGEITDDIDPEGVINGLASFGQDANGEVYVVSLYGGAIHKIVAQ